MERKLEKARGKGSEEKTDDLKEGKNNNIYKLR